MAALADVVDEVRRGSLAIDEALNAVAVKDLVKRADPSYVAAANRAAYKSLNDGHPDLALVWATAAKQGYDYLRPAGGGLRRISRRLTEFAGLNEEAIVYSEFLAGIAALRLGRYADAKASLHRAQAIAEKANTKAVTIADCARYLADSNLVAVD
jgi:hypothetical protein